MLGITPLSTVPLSSLEASSGAYTLTCDPGTLVLTGQSADLTPSNQTLTANPGTLTLTAQSVTLTVSVVPLTADPGTLTLTGQTASLNYERFPRCIPSGKFTGASNSASGAYTPSSMPTHQADDILLFIFETGTETVTVSGWTEAPGSPVLNSGTNPTQLNIFWKRATGSGTAAPTTSVLSDHAIGGVNAYRNCITSGDPFNVTASGTGTGTSITVPGDTTTVDYCLIVGAVASTTDNSSTQIDNNAANVSINPLTIYRNNGTSSGSGGALLVFDGYKPNAGAYSNTTMTQTPADEWAAWSGALLPTGAFVLTADPGTLTLTAQSATLSYSGDNLVLTANPGTLTLTTQDATLRYGRKLTANPGALILTPREADLNAQIDQVFTCGVIIDLILPEATGNYRNYTSSLTVDGSPIQIKEWTLEESDQSLNASLNIELADLSDRSLITRTSDIDFSLTTNGTTETLLSNGNLKRKDYSISRQGIGPDDRVTFTALPDMEARLNKVPATNTILYDSLRATLSADDFEGIYDKEHNYTPPEVMAMPGMTLFDVFQEVFVERCGFTGYVTNLPDFKVSVIDFAAGQSYMNGLGGVIGMFEPEFIPFGNYIEIKDGTAGLPAGSPTPREVTVSHARQIGVASDINRVDGLLIHVAQERFEYDYSNDRTVITQETDGAAGFFPYPQYTTTITTTYRDYFRTEHPTRPLKTEVVREVRVTSDGFENVNSSTEDRLFDSRGRMWKRTKDTQAMVPTVATGVLSLQDVLHEEERITYAAHPYQPRHYFVYEREVNQDGLVTIDAENQQLEQDYVRDVVSVYRAGNFTTDMTTDWRKVSTFKEQIEPLRNNYIRVRRVEIDWLANQKHEDRNELRQGEVGVNIFVNEQQRIYLTDAGEITGTVESVNMGDLDLDTAIALGERIRRNRNVLPNRVSFDLAFIDNSLQKGTAITAIGRNGEDLGTYIIEARTLFGSRDGYFMTLQARQAD